MPWLETDAMKERRRLIEDWLSGDYSKTELARVYGVSRKTVHTVLSRFDSEGWRAVEERSRAPQGHARAVAAAIERRVVEARGKHPSWGPKKLKAWLGRQDGGVSWPAASTIGGILDRHGLTVHRGRRRLTTKWSGDLQRCTAANVVWGIDFKGWFRLGDGRRCEPLSLSDLHSRYILRLVALQRPTSAAAWAILEGAFREFGLPLVLRSDNGQPFAGPGLCGLSQLAVKVIKAGVTPERIAPGKPQQNGRQERLHLTVQQDTASPPAATWRGQQRRLAMFVREFNEERPHEALAQTPPAQHYAPSPRLYGGRLRDPEYGPQIEVRRVHPHGTVRWAGQAVFVSQALAGEWVGLEPTERDGVMRLRFGHMPLAMLKADGKLEPLAGARARQRPSIVQKV